MADIDRGRPVQKQPLVDIAQPLTMPYSRGLLDQHRLHLGASIKIGMGKLKFPYFRVSKLY
jgi:hypothetical protein